jgi:SAM-dependent methyltransferase
MAQTTTGLRAVFSSPRVYDFAQDLVGAERLRAVLLRDHVHPRAGQRLLDIGCGTARVLSHLPQNVAYVGVDLSSAYVDAAKNAYGARGEFHCVDIGGADPGRFEGFDVALAIGLLHHLDDDEALNMLAVAHRALAQDGRLITVDGCFEDGQSRMARYTIERDRGRNVRTPEAYADLARQVFERVQVSVRRDLIRIPYSHAVLECRR